MLVAAGASLTTRDANGLTPMMVAFQVEDNDLATYLESKFHRIPFHFISFYAVRLNRFMEMDIQYINLVVLHWCGVCACVCELEEFFASANFKCIE